ASVLIQQQRKLKTMVLSSFNTASVLIQLGKQLGDFYAIQVSIQLLFLFNSVASYTLTYELNVSIQLLFLFNWYHRSSVLQYGLVSIQLLFLFNLYEIHTS